MPPRPLVGALGALVAISASLVHPSQPAQAGAAPMPPVRYVRLAAPVRVNPSALSPNRSLASGAPAPHLHRNQAAYDARRAVVDQGTRGRRTGLVMPTIQ